MLDKEIELLSVQPCGYAKIKDSFRYQLLIKGNNIYILNKYITHIKKHTTLTKGVELFVDVDPLSTYFKRRGGVEFCTSNQKAVRCFQT